MASSASFTLTHDLTGHPEHRPILKETIPKGEVIVVIDHNHSETDSLIEWSGKRLIVDKMTLESFT